LLICGIWVKNYNNNRAWAWKEEPLRGISRRGNERVLEVSRTEVCYIYMWRWHNETH
jgi:hypothetical protein